MAVTVADRQTRQLAAELVSLRQDVDALKAGGRQTQLAFATVENGGSIKFKDANGNIAGAMGFTQTSDSDEKVFHVQAMNSGPPSAPPAPTVTPIADGATVSHNGSGQPVDYAYHNIYSQPGGLQGRLYGADSLPIAPLEAGTPVQFWLTQVNTSGRESAASPKVSVTPTAVVAKELLDGIVTEVKIAGEAVTAAKVKANAIQEIHIDSGAVTNAKMAVNAIKAVNIDTGAVTAGAIKANAVTAVAIAQNSIEAPHILAGAVTAGKIAAGAVTAGTIEAGAVTANSLAANSVEAQHIVAGQIFAGHIAAGAIQAEHLTADSVTAHNIAANSITAQEITARAINADHIASDTIQARHITSQSITTDKFAALSITADKIAANTIDAGHLRAGAVTASKLEANMVLASRIIVGSSNGNRLELHPTVGLQGFNGGIRRLWFDPSTGNLLATGTWRTGLYEDAKERIEVAEDGTQTFVAANNFVSGKIENDGLNGLTFRSGKLGTNAGYLFLNSSSVAIRWGTIGGVVPASFTATNEGIQAWGRLIGLRYEARYAGDNTTPRVFMLGTTPAGSDIGQTVLHFQNRSTLDNAAAIVAPTQNCGIVFYPNEIQVTTGNPTVYGTARCNAWNTPSSETLKSEISEISIAGGRTEWDLIEGAPALSWYYNQDGYQDDVPRATDGEQVMLRRFHEGEEYWVPAEFTEGPAKVKKHYGPLAEDLHAIDPRVVLGAPEDPSQFATDQRDMVGILWAAMDKMIKRQRILERRLAQAGLLEMPRWPGSGDMVEGVGRHRRGRTRRRVDPETGQAVR